MKADDFLNVDLQKPDFEQERIARLISALLDYPQPLKGFLAREFLGVVGDPKQPFGRRLQAASMLAYQNASLGVKGSREFAQAVCEVLQREGRRVAEQMAVQTAKVVVEPLNGADRLLIGNLVTAALFIDFGTAKPFAEEILNSIADTETSFRIMGVIAIASRKNEP